MLKLGIIGTGAIAHHFVAAAHATKKYQLTAVYSRTMETAKSFAQDYESEVNLYITIEELLASTIDILYIASPNSLHYEQAKSALKARKHVIVEKPAVTRPNEWTDLVETAKEKKVFIFEAARNYHENAFTVIADFLADKDVWGAHFSYMKYSSKMPDLLAGKTPNVFSSRFAGGALMDLGIYPVYASIRLFGSPVDAHYLAHHLPNRIDVNGSGQLIYKDFQVTIQTGKNSHSSLPAEIYTNQGTLVLDSIEHISSAIFYPLQGEPQPLAISKAAHTMLEEVVQFANMIAQPQPDLYESWLLAAQAVHTTLYRMRQTAHIHFEGDLNEDDTSR
ncbi:MULTISPECIES: Gfo/Idh/MocA family protein [unclassified Streptococcus]|uniref:Gfo/Idh/MocA family protein n=1 Tax=unclassified Streptococcus TaxID=2608887 RepID=UPI0010726209|nr:MULTISPECIES: Gfo/Idh/MocA family oxidoreductase [unclassified Streptococcus]MBF0786799.1 Gfo/Idh/MocA family oxidoreductase [Streptococcus sp. 19428wC2_LYSM12]MCQ9211039.1 Gfo/Idh/MocA family oxidoreductase [Streptococcus sp. B01]MCQ9214313.1 Gfo/Idh/MocA family oxidoreductase [Streptococcus sp. O1]TFV06341.1 Gfo/Idh/MocA family oxidoreductase [Streptococcus sp. LYSM12]